MAERINHKYLFPDSNLQSHLDQLNLVKAEVLLKFVNEVLKDGDRGNVAIEAKIEDFGKPVKNEKR